jgi:hypothetical protein
MIKRLILLTIAVVVLTSCESNDERLAKMAQDSVEQQKAQNQEMSRLNREVAQDVAQLVEAENESRRELIGLPRDLQDQQAEVNSQRDALEVERQTIVHQRHRESLLAPVISSVGLLMVCALPLVLAWYLLQVLRSENDDDVAIGELLVQELTSDHPRLLQSVTETSGSVRNPISMLPVREESEPEENHIESD